MGAGGANDVADAQADPLEALRGKVDAEGILVGVNTFDPDDIPR